MVAGRPDNHARPGPARRGPLMEEPHTMKRIKLLSVAAVAALAVSACGSTYDREQAIDDLVSEGIEEPVATCIIDGVEDNFSVEKLESTDDLTEEDEAILLEITTDCLLADLGS